MSGLSAHRYTQLVSSPCAAPRSAAQKDGYAIHVYACNSPMVDACLTNADGDMLIVPQQGDLAFLQ